LHESDVLVFASYSVICVLWTIFIVESNTSYFPIDFYLANIFYLCISFMHCDFYRQTPGVTWRFLRRGGSLPLRYRKYMLIFSIIWKFGIL